MMPRSFLQIALMAGLLMFLAPRALADDAAIFQQAAAAFATGDASGAAKLYEDLLARHPGHLALCYNLGTAYARLDRRAEALWLLRRVLTYNPGHAAARQNLDYLMEQTGTPSADARTPLAWVERRMGSWTTLHLRHGGSMLAVVLTASLLVAASLVVAVGRRKRAATLVRVGALLGIMVLLAALPAAWTALREGNRAQATLLREAPVYSGPGAESFAHLVDLPAGRVVTLVSPKVTQGYVRILLSDDRSGFIARDALGIHQLAYFDQDNSTERGN